MNRSRADATSTAWKALPSLIAPVLIVLAAGLATWKLTIGDRAIARGDLLLYFYPLRDYASAAIREGRLPLWNPYTFMGAPFLANSQAGFFYPLNVVTAWLPVEQAVSWNIVLHLCLAGLGAYWLARRGLRLGLLASFASGLSFGLGGYLGAQVEHLNQIQVLAWLPFQVLCLLAVRRGNAVKMALVMAALIALQVFAGHTQSLYICLVGLGLTGVALMVSEVSGRPIDRDQSHHAGRSPRLSPRLARLARAALPLGVVGAAGLLAVVLSAAQLLPTLELATQSARSGGLPYNEVGSFSWRPWVVARALMPTYGDPLFPEYVAYFGAAGLALALLGVVSSIRHLRPAPATEPGARPDREPSRVFLVVLTLTVVGFVLALGVVSPLFGLLYRWIPGFNLFRAQARWLALFALGVSMLVGLGVQALRRGESRQSTVVWLASWCALVGTGVMGLWLGARISPEPEYQALPARPVLTAWLVGIVAMTLLIMGHLIIGERWRGRRFWATAATALLLAELGLASQFQPYARASDREAIAGLRPATAHLLAERELSEPTGSGQRILALSGLFFDPGDMPEQRLIYQGWLSEDELYDRIIAAKHKEVLSPNLSLYYRLPSVDGYDGGLLPLKRYADFVSQFAPRENARTADGRLREFLTEAPANQWLEQMAVGYVIADKTLNVPIDNVFYDLQFTQPLSQPFTQALEPFEATAIGVVLSAPGSQPGATLGSVQIDIPGRPAQQVDLVAGESIAQPFFALRLELGGRGTPASITITPGVTSLALRGLASIDEDAGVFLTQLVRGTHDLRLAYSGDVKIYENRAPAPRVVVRDGQGAPAGSAVIKAESPEQVVIEVEATQDAQLVLRDACYPGWGADVGDRPTPIKCADILFRSIDVPAGRHTVTFAYQPGIVQWGIALSTAGVVAWAILVILAARRRVRPPS